MPPPQANVDYFEFWKKLNDELPPPFGPKLGNLVQQENQENHTTTNNKMNYKQGQ